MDAASPVLQSFMMFPIFTLIVFIIFAIPLLIALLKLRRRPMNEFLRLLWVIFLLVIPIIGPIVFMIVHPGDEEASTRRSL
jgi:uncharacterized membrane protein YhaH (DUF805 family)